MEASFFSAALSLGALVGTLSSGPIAEFTGRRLALLIAAPLEMAAYLMIALGSSPILLIIARIIAGLSMGICSFVCSVYIGEMAPTRFRGLFGACTQLMMGLGILLIYVFGAACRTQADSTDPLATSSTFCDWRLVAYLCLIPGGLLFITMFLAPETPRWLATRGKLEIAEANLRRVRGVDAGDHEEDYIDDELNALISVSDAARKATKSKSDIRARFHVLFSCPKQLIICTMNMAFTQFSGINALTFFQTTIFEMAGLKDSDVLAITVRIVSTLANFPALYLVDRLGRRPLIISSAAGMCLSQFLMGLFFYLDRDGDAHNIAWLALLASYGYQFTYSWGVGPIRWMLASELFPDEARGLASAATTTVNWICAFIFILFLDSVVQATSMQAAFWFFSCVGAVMAVFEYFMVPETKGKTLEEIQKLF
ncbi:hexose transporter, putative [Perkinsus marinus ATCC 50983]|uniref:Hexose transporter 1 n=1 Tax=Perkinsus marinus (strain ATCC 50983 / TXsc) TaxID=423536 RepID=C5L6U0_PERM5|nr:hexose transporter, putative [Perkinsus marinus ATCC 50983]EER07555.1 hexose transporter, putative [Perkinsus marinus ATCC 50983]|eukprot:XP_002775739.1 hexose transporter, putative [Perkinsus marinus ATCC 50983]